MNIPGQQLFDILESPGLLTLLFKCGGSVSVPPIMHSNRTVFLSLYSFPQWKDHF